jgi:uncharacterized protein
MKNVDTEVKQKLERLKKRLVEIGPSLIAFSGGVDSTFLLKVGEDALGEGVLAVTWISPLYPSWEREQVEMILGSLKARHMFLYTDELDDEIRFNPVERCYFCKRNLILKLRTIAKQHSLKAILDGSILDDLHDFRPGTKASLELGVISPLKDLNYTKSEIREALKFLGIPIWNNPSSSCLATRIPYSEEITIDRLKRIDESEKLLRGMGFEQLRVRDHGTVARIEIDKGSTRLLLSDKVRSKITKKLKELGYNYITLDMEGYRSGSMDLIR